ATAIFLHQPFLPKPALRKAAVRPLVLYVGMEVDAPEAYLAKGMPERRPHRVGPVPFAPLPLLSNEEAKLGGVCPETTMEGHVPQKLAPMCCNRPHKLGGILLRALVPGVLRL